MGVTYVINTDNLLDLSEEERELVLKVLKERGKEIDPEILKLLEAKEEDEVLDNEEEEEIDRTEEVNDILSDITKERNKIINGEYDGNRENQLSYLSTEDSRIEQLKEEIGEENLDYETVSRMEELGDALDTDRKKFGDYYDAVQGANEKVEKDKDISHVLNKFKPITDHVEVRSQTNEDFVFNSQLDKNIPSNEMEEELQDPKAYEEYKETGYVPKKTNPYDIFN